MPRAGGVYTLPAGNPVVTLTIISSTWANTTFADVATALTGSVPTDGSAPMTGALRLIDGAVNTPGLTWATETTSGLYRIGANDFGFSVAGVKVLEISIGQVKVPDGAVNAPGFSWSTEATSGWYRIGANQFGFSVAGVNALSVNANRGWNIPTPVAGATLTLNAIAAGQMLSGSDGTVNATGTFVGVAFSLGTTTAHTLQLISSGNVRVQIGSTGNIIINAGTGTTLTVNQGAGTVPGILAIGAGNMVAVQGDLGVFNIRNTANSNVAQWGTVKGWTGAGSVTDTAFGAIGALNFYVGGAVTVATGIDSNGRVTVNNPIVTSGGFGNYSLNVGTPTGAGGSFGLYLRAGTNNTDRPFLINNAADTVSYFQMLGDGGVILGVATGGNQGLGTLNASGLYVNSGQLFFGAPASANTTATVTDVGKVINAAGNIAINNAVFLQGHILSIYNNSAASITINGTITTMRLAGTVTTGNRTLLPRGMATIWFEGASECIVSGAGVS